MAIKLHTLTDDDAQDMFAMNAGLVYAPIYRVGASPELIKLYEDFKSKLQEEFDFDN